MSGAAHEIGGQVELSVDGSTIATLPRPKHTRPSVLSFSLPKAGSVLLESIMADLAHRAGLGYFSLETVLFERGIPVDDAPADASSSADSTRRACSDSTRSRARSTYSASVS